jgi:phosphoribosylformylglycinamidine synthase
MTPYELMLSESQERMLMVVHRGREDEALAVFRKWDLDAAVIGRVTSSGRVVVRMHGQVHADLPAAPLAEGLAYSRPTARPAYLDEVAAFEPAQLPSPADLGAVLLQVLRAADIASKRWIYEQYDHNVRHGTVLRPGQGDAGVVRVRTPDGQREKGVAVTTGCPNRMVWLDPFEGSRLAVAEACANLVATGARPLATTDCLNFGNPEKPEIMWQFVESVRGLGDACRVLGTPIVSGNVSLYNETDGKAIHPTPMIGMIGLIDDVTRRVPQAFAAAGQVVGLVGAPSGELGGSQYLKTVHGRIAGKVPVFDGPQLVRTFAVMLEAARQGLLDSAHDVSDGGLAVALAECCISGPLRHGARLVVSEHLGKRPEALLFSEGPGRFVVSCSQAAWARLAALCDEAEVACEQLGETGGAALVIATGTSRIDLGLDALAEAWSGGLAAILEVDRGR